MKTVLGFSFWAGYNCEALVRPYRPGKKSILTIIREFAKGISFMDARNRLRILGF